MDDQKQKSDALLDIYRFLKWLFVDRMRWSGMDVRSVRDTPASVLAGGSRIIPGGTDSQAVQFWRTGLYIDPDFVDDSTDNTYGYYTIMGDTTVSLAQMTSQYEAQE